MPLLFTPPQTGASVLAGIPHTADAYFLVFSASLGERGRPWDCENVLGPLAVALKDREASTIYVGNRDEWNAESNPFRQAPFNVERVPTVLRLPGDWKGTVEERVASASRIVEADILEGSKLRAFLKG
ncbi:hypothetical protein RQP46_006020 [Phenoliferia psychrophenolica]